MFWGDRGKIKKMSSEKKSKKGISVAYPAGLCYNIDNFAKGLCRKAVSPAGKGCCPMAKVTLLTYTPQPEKAVAAAAKLCYSPASISDITEAVSYTHLDVYKRQRERCGPWARPTGRPAV